MHYNIASVSSVLGAFLLWQFVISPIFKTSFIPPPSEIIKGMGELIFQKRTLLPYCEVSLERIFIGWSIGSGVGIFIGLLVGNFTIFKKLLDPFIHFLRFLPAIALVTVFMIWFGVGELSKILLIIYATSFTVMIQTATGVGAVDEEKIQAARCLGANDIQVFLHVTVPATIPYIYVGMRLAMASSFLVIVAVEMLAASSGIGYLIWNSRLFFRTDWMYAGIIVLGLLGFATDRWWRMMGNTIFKRYVREYGRY